MLLAVRLKKLMIMTECTSEQLTRVVAGLPPKTVALCSLVVGGGPETLHTVHAMLLREKPVVVLKGTGGVADLLSFACENIVPVPEVQCVTDTNTDFKRCVRYSIHGRNIASKISPA